MAEKALVWTNVGMFIAASLVAFGSLNKMRAGHTRPCIIGAVLLLAIGCAAQALGQVSSQWDHIADTLVGGGLLALLIASQRTHSWALERWANPIASVLGLLVGGVFLVWLLSGCTTVEEKPAPPACDFPAFTVYRSPHGMIFGLAQDEVRELQQQIRSLAAGTCRLPAPQT